MAYDDHLNLCSDIHQFHATAPNPPTPAATAAGADFSQTTATVTDPSSSYVNQTMPAVVVDSFSSSGLLRTTAVGSSYSGQINMAAGGSSSGNQTFPDINNGLGGNFTTNNNVGLGAGTNNGQGAGTNNGLGAGTNNVGLGTGTNDNNDGRLFTNSELQALLAAIEQQQQQQQQFFYPPPPAFVPGWTPPQAPGMHAWNAFGAGAPWGGMHFAAAGGNVVAAQPVVPQTVNNYYYCGEDGQYYELFPGLVPSGNKRRSGEGPSAGPSTKKSKSGAPGESQHDRYVRRVLRIAGKLVPNRNGDQWRGVFRIIQSFPFMCFFISSDDQGRMMLINEFASPNWAHLDDGAA